MRRFHPVRRDVHNGARSAIRRSVPLGACAGHGHRCQRTRDWI